MHFFEKNLPAKLTLFLIFIVCLCPIQSYGQSEIDSLNKILPSLQGKPRIDALNSLASYLSYIEPAKADSVLDISQGLIDKISYEQGQVKKWLVQATLANFRSHYDQSDSLLNLAVVKSERVNYPEGLANAHLTLGTLNARRGNLAVAIEHYIKSIEAAKATSNYDLWSSNLMNIGLINMSSGDLEKSQEFLLEAAEVAREHGLNFRLAQCQLNLGSIYFSRGDVETSIKNIKEAYVLFESVDDKLGMAKASGNLAFAYDAKGDYKSAIDAYEQALTIYQDLESKAEIFRTRLNIAKVYKNQGAFGKAEEETRSVLTESDVLDEFSIKTIAFNLLLQIYEQRGDYKSALQAYKQLRIVEDSIENRADKVRLDALKTQFETERKDDQLKLKSQQIDLLEKDSQLARTRQYLLVSAVIILAFTALMLRQLYLTKLKRSRMNEQIALERGDTAERKNSELTLELELRTKELQDYAHTLAEHKEELAKLKTREDEQLSEVKSNYLNEISQNLNRKDVELFNWQSFRLMFDEVHSGFVGSLKSSYPALSDREVDLCILLKVGVPNTEISQILEITYDGVKKAIRRVYKKLDLTSAQELRTSIAQID